MADAALTEISDDGVAILCNPNAFVSTEEIREIEDEHRQDMEAKRAQEARRYDRTLKRSDYLRRREERDRLSHLGSVVAPSTAAGTEFPSPRRGTATTRGPERRRSRAPHGIDDVIHDVASRVDSRISPEDLRLVTQNVFDRVMRDRGGDRRRRRDPGERTSLDYLRDDEVDSRLEAMSHVPDDYGVDTARSSRMQQYDFVDPDRRRKEIKYWRKRMNVEDKAMGRSFYTYIQIVADIAESFFDVLGIHAFETRDLNDKIELAVKAGEFEPAMRRYVNSGGSEMMRNPYWNAFATFARVALKNHLKKKKKAIMGDRPARRKKKRKQARKVKKAKAKARRADRRQETRKSDDPASDSSSGSSDSSDSDSDSDTDPDSEDDAEVKMPSPKFSIRHPRRRQSRHSGSRHSGSGQRQKTNALPRSQQGRRSAGAKSDRSLRTLRTSASRSAAPDVTSMSSLASQHSRESASSKLSQTPSSASVATKASAKSNRTRAPQAEIVVQNGKHFIRDPKTGKLRPKLTKPEDLAPLTHLMDKMQSFKPAVKHLNRHLQDEMETQREFDALGPAPGPADL